MRCQHHGHSYCIILFVSCQRGVSRGWSSAAITALSCLFHVKEVSVGDGPQSLLLHYLVCFMSKRCQ